MLNELFNKLVNQILPLYSRNEAENIVFILFEDILGIYRTEIFIRNRVLDQDQMDKMQLAIKELIKGKPVQYVTGFCWFLDFKFLVNENVLIPRPETEELVLKIVTSNQLEHPDILDIGTGSGCIAVSLQKMISGATLDALDISEDALKIAKKNAIANQVEINFATFDILSENEDLPFSKKYDIIVSNPPYITESEKSLMLPNVLNFEPHNALFVSDEDPLLYYKVIAKKGKELLKPGGKVYLEINESFGTEIARMFLEFSYQYVDVIKDFYGKDRIVIAG